MVRNSPEGFSTFFPRPKKTPRKLSFSPASSGTAPELSLASGHMEYRWLDVTWLQVSGQFPNPIPLAPSSIVQSDLDSVSKRAVAKTLFAICYPSILGYFKYGTNPTFACSDNFQRSTTILKLAIACGCRTALQWTHNTYFDHIEYQPARCVGTDHVPSGTWTYLWYLNIPLALEHSYIDNNPLIDDLPIKMI